LPYTEARKGDRIYIDSNVLVYCFYSKYRTDYYLYDYHNKAKDFLSKVQSGKFEGITSSITIMEFVKILRESFIEYGKMKSMRDVEERVRECVSALFSIKHIKIIEGRVPELKPMFEAENLYYYAVSNEALQIMQRYVGKIVTDVETGEPKHSGLHPTDAFHVVLAKQLKCDKLATFAWEFKETEREITPLILIDHNTFW